MDAPALDLATPTLPPMTPPAPPPDDAASFAPAAGVIAATMRDFALSADTTFASLIACIRRGDVRLRFPGRDGAALSPPIELGSRRLSARAFDRIDGRWHPLDGLCVDAEAVRAAFDARWIARAPFRPATPEQLADAAAWLPWQDEAPFALLHGLPPLDPSLAPTRTREFVAQMVLLNLCPIAQRVGGTFAPVSLTAALVAQGCQDDAGAVCEGEGGIIRMVPPPAPDARATIVDLVRPVVAHLPSLRGLLLDVVEGRVARPASSVFAKLPQRRA